MLIATLKGISWIFCALPLRTALAMGRALGTLLGSVIRYHRKDAIEALARSFPEKTPRERRDILNRMYKNLGTNIVEVLRFARIGDHYLRESIEWDDDQEAREVLAANKGLLVLSAHTGNWDLLCTVAPRFNYPATVITKNLRNSALNSYWMGTRARFGLKFVPAHNSYRQCLAALRNNEIVAFILDQNMINTEGIFVDFLGKPACTSPGLAYMSAQSGAAVAPMFIIRLENGKHRVKVLPTIPPPPDRKPDTIRIYTQRYTKVIENVIREHPDQWIWIHRRWRTVPPAQTEAQQSA